MEEKEKLFLEIIDGFQWKYDSERYKDTLFAFKNKSFLFKIFFKEEDISFIKLIVKFRLNFEHDFKDACFVFFNKNIFYSFNEHFNMKEEEVKKYISEILKNKFKFYNTKIYSETEFLQNEIEEYFNSK